MKTADALYQIYKNGGQITSAIAVDLFGMMNWPTHLDNTSFNNRLTLMDGIYKGLYLMNVPASEIEKHRRENTLDTLIHTKYKGHSSGYYTTFCDQKTVIGPTHIL